MTQPTQAQIKAAENTDRELWREREGDYYADSIHVTKDGGIGMNVGGSVVVMPIRKWFALTAAAQVGEPALIPFNHPAYIATIERCAQVAEGFPSGMDKVKAVIARNIAAELRKLKDAP